MEQLAKQDWTPKAVAHLLKRAAFGATKEEITLCHQLGMETTVDAIVLGRLHGSRGENNHSRLNPKELLPIPSIRKKSTGYPQAPISYQDSHKILFTLQYQWLDRMLGVNAPLEKMTLFWHGMLTSGYSKVVNAAFMVRQNQLFREHAFGDYRELIKLVVMDPAMVIYLDIDKNKRTNPNENFARELLEMFTLGEGNYGSELIKVLAKDIVGYRLKRTNNSIPVTEEDMKGMEANSGFNDKRKRLTKLVDKIFNYSACGDLLITRLWKFYVSIDGPDLATLVHLKGILKKSKWNVGVVMKEIFSSKQFYAASVMGQQIKSPVQCLVQAHKELDSPVIDLKCAYYSMQMLGQSLFNPPNVAGWPAGKSWLNGATLSSRYALSSHMILLIDKQKLDLAEKFLAQLKKDELGAIQMMLDYFFSVELPIKKTTIVIDLARKVKTEKDMAAFIEYLMCMPEYQLC